MMPPGASLSTWIATWLVQDSDETGTFMPNVNGSSADPRIQAIYAKCVAIFFATSLRQNPSVRHILFTNVEVALAGGTDIIAQVREWGVDVIHVEPRYRLPPGAISVFANQFYVLEVIQHLAETAPDDCRVMLLDADCLILAPLAAMADAITKHGVLGYPLPYEEVNGSSIKGMQQALQEYAPEVAGRRRVVYWGGELFAATGRECRIIAARIPALWDIAVRHAFDPGWIKEEAHLLSVLYAAHEPAIGDASPFIRRISTAFKFTDTAPSDMNLTIWHLPGEKKFGLRRFYRLVANPSSRFWRAPPEQIRFLAADYLGVPRRNLRKFLLDATQKTVARVGRRLRREG